MALPEMPWYNKLKEWVAPSDEVTKVVLVILIAVSIALLLWGDEVTRALWVVYWVSP